MHARRYLLVLLILLLVSIFTTAFTASAQSSDVCGAVLTQAKNEAGTNCADQADGTTCAGHGAVSRTTSSGVISTTYSSGGDRANLATTHSVTSGPLNTATGEYGINILKPLSSTGVGLTYVVFGGAELTNVGGAGQAIWQSVGLSVDGNPAPCASIVSALVIQSPKGTTSTLTVNGGTMTISSTGYVRLLPGGLIEIGVLDGSFTIGGITITAGQKVTAQLNADGSIVPGSYSGPDVIPPADLAAILLLLNGLPANLLEYVPGNVVVNCPSGVGAPNCTVTTGS
jgi:uncharacterized protein (UPF0333 family)